MCERRFSGLEINLNINFSLMKYKKHIEILKSICNKKIFQIFFYKYIFSNYKYNPPMSKL